MIFFFQERKPYSLAVAMLLFARTQGVDHENGATRLRKNKDQPEHWETAIKPLKQHHRLNERFDERSGPIEERIIGGTNAAPGEFPFFVQGQGCGASLIWYDIALTAAHCYGSPFNSVVYIGNHRWSTVDSGVLTRNVLQQVRIPNSDLGNDFMVLKLSSEVPRSGPIQPIQINSLASSPATNAPLTAIGFGVTSPTNSQNSPLSPNLMKVGVNYVSPTACNAAWGGGNNATTMLCAGLAGKGVCFGDSGGPIIDSAGVQVGLASFVASCMKNIGVPDVYARTSAGYTWIRSQICALASNPPSYCSTNTGTRSSVVITVQEDTYPEETAWVLKNSAGQVLASQNAGSVRNPNAVIQKTLSLHAGTYTFVMTDVYGDGICCNYGNGFFNIKVNGATVVSSNGVFGSSIQRQFTIGPRSFTPSEWATDANQAKPLASGIVTGLSAHNATKPCKDSVDGVFETNQNIGKQTCEWLRSNMGNFGYLCDLVKVARVCPKTCSLCGSSL